MVAAPVYAVRGPVPAQDGRQAFVVVRRLAAPAGLRDGELAMAECLTLAAAEQHAQALNDAAQESTR